MFAKENTLPPNESEEVYIPEQQMFVRTESEYEQIFDNCGLQLVSKKTQHFKQMAIKPYPATMFVLKPKVRDWKDWGQ